MGSRASTEQSPTRRTPKGIEVFGPRHFGQDLESRALLENTLVVVVSDHGEGLGDHEEDEHGLLAYDSTLHVPWIMRLPNRRHAGGTIDEPVSLVDVLPTLATLVGAIVPAQIDGADRTGFIAAGQGTTDALYAETYYPRLRMGWSEITTIRSGEYKYIRAPTPELYNYNTDPGETTNLAGRHPEVVARLDRILTRVLAEHSAPAAGSSTPDPQTVRQLQALGYVSGTASPIDANKRLADPKTKTGAYRDLMRARQQLAEGSQAAGLRTLRALVLADPDLEVARRTIREYWIGKRRFDEAEQWLRSALARHGSHAGLWRDLAMVTRAAGDAATARQAIARAIDIRPEDSDSLIVSGEIERDLRQLDAALSLFKQAVEYASDPLVPRMQALVPLPDLVPPVRAPAACPRRTRAMRFTSRMSAPHFLVHLVEQLDIYALPSIAQPLLPHPGGPEAIVKHFDRGM